MKTTQTKQRGFFDLGFSLVLLAIFGGTTAIIVSNKQDQQISAEVRSLPSDETIAKQDADANP